MSKKSSILVLVVFFATIFTNGPVLALTPKDDKWVKTLKSPRIAFEWPEWFTPFEIDEAPIDLDYWVNLLPEEKDKAAEMYVVMPTLGLITPVIMVPEGTNDYVNMTTGKEIDINKYLNDGVMHYPGTGMPWEEGNPVIFGHSNFFKHWEWRYKTIFADIMNLDVGFEDEMRVFTKIALWESLNPELLMDGQYEKKRFRVFESYDTVPTDVGILNPKWWKELTIFACTNGLEWRWILRGRLIEDNEVLVPLPLRARYLRAIEKMDQLPEARQEEIQQIFLDKAAEMKQWVTGKTYEAKFKKYLLSYFMREIE